MKKIKYALAALALACTFAFTLVEVINWKVKDNAYAIKFKGGKVDGTFKGLKAILAFDENNLAGSKVWASVDVSTINTGNGMKDNHALSESGLDAKQFPLITFESASIAKKENGYEAKGKLTIKGVAKDIVMPFTFENKGSEAAFKGNFSIAPKDFNVTRGGTPETMDVELVIPVNK